MSYESNILGRSPPSYWRMAPVQAAPSDEIVDSQDTGNTFSFSTQDGFGKALFFNADRSRMFLVGGEHDALYEYALATPGDITTASYTGNSFDLSPQGTAPEGLFFKPDGSRFYVVESGNDNVSQYDMSTPWDITTAALAGQFSVLAETGNPTGVFFTPDGTRMFVVAWGPDQVFQYTIGTAWDVTSASYDSVSLDVSVAIADQATDLGFNNDGTKLYIIHDGTTDRVYQWSLGTGWDLSTATGPDDWFSAENKKGCFFDLPDDGRYWLISNTTVEEYSTGSGSGTTFPDSGSLVNDGVQSGTVRKVQGLLVRDGDPAVKFEGTGHVVVPHNAAYSISTTGALSLELIMRLGVSEASPQTVMEKDAEWIIRIINGDTLRAIAFKDNGAVLQQSDVPISLDTTHHVGIDFTGVTNTDDIGITLNGVAQTPTVANGTDGTIETGTGDVTIGSGLDDTVLDEVVIYDANLTTQQYLDDYHAMGVRRAHTAVFGLRLATAHTARIPLRVGAAHAAPIAFGVRRGHTAPIALLQPVRAAHAAVFDLRAGDPVRAAHTARIPLRVGVAHTAVAPLMAFVRRAHAAVWDLRIDVRAAHTAAVPLLDHDPVRRAHAAVFSLLGAPRTHMTMNVSATTGGRTIPVLSWDIRADEGGYLYEGEIDTDANGYGLVAVNDALTLDLFGEAYELVIESRRRDKRGPAGRRFVLGVRSPTVRFDFPRADPVTRTFDEPVLARAAVEALLGEAVSWELVDWPIPAFRLAFEEASPIAAAQQIVEAAGGTIQTDPDGTLRVRHLYPTSPKNLYTDATAARVIDDQDDVTASSESFEPRRLVDRLSLRDTVEAVFSDRLEFVPDEDNDRAGTVHVYPSPWRTNVVVTHTSNASLQLTLLGETTREETEVVAFTAGTARLRYPIDALLAVSWLYDSLGGVSFEPYATEIAAGGEAGYSLAEITYRTRSIDYRLVSPTVDQAQLLLQEVA